jgi:hypothetical protein
MEAAKCAPWRRSEIEQMGGRDGARMAALEFFWTHRQELQREVFTGIETSVVSEICVEGKSAEARGSGA